MEKELCVIKYLIEEIENESEYKKHYELAVIEAKKKHEVSHGKGFYWRHMPEEFSREPKKSVIEANAKKIRQILLKFYR